MTTEPAPASTLIIAPNWVGDTVMALPTLAALASSGRRLTVLSRPHLRPLLRLVPDVAAVVDRGEATAETVGRIEPLAFAEAVVLTNSFRGAWLSRRCGIPVRWGYRGDGRSLLLRPAVARPPRTKHQLRDYDRLLEGMGIRPNLDPPRIAVSADASIRGREALERTRLVDAESPLVGLFIGAEYGPSKRWPPERFAEAARRLRRRAPRSQAVVVAGPKEVPLAVALHRAAGGVFPVVGPDLDLAALAGLLSCLDVLITNDSGPMHLAAAVGTPCVALFGPTNPVRTSPCGPGHHVLYEDRWCSPCFRRRCPLLHQRCMRDIDVDAVAAAATTTLAAAGYSIS